MGRTACTEPQCLYKGALYLTFICCLKFLYYFDVLSHADSQMVSQLKSVEPVVQNQA